MTFAARDSLISTDSNTTYPSTLSSYGPSSLGLTDSPPQLRGLRAAHGKTSPLAANNVARIPRVGSKPRLRSAPSNPSLPVVTETSPSGADTHPSITPDGDAKTARLNSFVAEARRAAIPQAGTEQSRLANRPVQAKRSQGSLAPPVNPSPGVPRATTASPRPRPAANGSSPAIAIPVRPTATPHQARVNAAARPPASPARTEATMAEEWEAELVRDAKKLQLQPRPRSRPSTTNLKSVREDVEWERSCMWDAQRDVARQAEDSTRREASREIAYPPAMPRIPIRAAPSGVTSVHVGVRPRIHPSRAPESLQRNQPDAQLDPPLSSTDPSQVHPVAAETTVRGSYNQLYVSSLADKAKEEYEPWLGRKAEREGGIDEDGGGHGTRDWQPKQRVVALPGTTAEPVLVDADVASTAAVPTEQSFAWDNYAYQQPFHSIFGFQPQVPYDVSQLYPGSYWDPGMWWMNPQPSPASETSASSGTHPSEEESKASKVHFAPSPEKLRHRASTSDLASETFYPDA